MAETKPVSFRVPEEVSKLIEQLREKSGLESGPWFISVIRALAERDILDETVRIAPDLARAFESDVDKLNNALDVIKQTYINQMSGLKTHLDKVEQHHQKQMEDLSTKHQEQLNTLVARKEELEYQLRTETQLRHQAEQQEKEAEHESELLRRDYTNLNLQLQTTNEALKQREERIAELTSNIVDLNAERTKFQALRDENETYHQEMASLKDSVHDLNNQVASLKAEADRVRTQAQLDIATAVARKEAEVQERVSGRFEDYQNRINVLLDKLEAEREESARLRHELALQQSHDKES